VVHAGPLLYAEILTQQLIMLALSPSTFKIFDFDVLITAHLHLNQQFV